MGPPIHHVYSELRGDHLVVVEQGLDPERGLIEVLDLATGKERRRWVLGSKELAKR